MMPKPTKAERERRRLEATAYHEAGHVVACLELGRAFRSVTILPGDGYLGCVHYRPWPKSIKETGYADGRTERWLERQALIALAGPAAEARFVGRYDHRAAGRDYDHLLDIALSLYGDEDVASKYWAFIRARAKQFVKHPHHWIQIEVLAAELVIRQTLSFRQAKEVCRAGRRNDARFMELLKAAVKEDEERQQQLAKEWGEQSA